jgi:hypothetical protein
MINRTCAASAWPNVIGCDSPSRRPRPIYPLMPPLDLTEEDRAELVRLLRDTIEADRFALSPRIRGLKRILAKLAPRPAAPEPLPPPKPSTRPSAAMAKKRRR